MENKFYHLSPSEQQQVLQHQQEQPRHIDWNARFSATKRTYVYRMIHLPVATEEYNIPFEHDRAWILDRKSTGGGQMNIKAMQEAASYMVGNGIDYSSFRGKSCQRSSPVVNVLSADVSCTPYYGNYTDFAAANMMTMINDDFSQHNKKITSSENESSSVTTGTQPIPASLITFTISGDSFVYRQVRNMVGCLVEIGKGKLQPTHVKDLLEKRQRKLAPAMAPAHGLFLVDVEHGDFSF
uniref:tRNA pseudouridine synthase n=2 Tax=Ditylum brightwellii TaxID=49249 RepID=A0A7S1YW30_9STRA|mmetsp:Transcript_18818/g.28086  ORF Transcript_18818/g.28086 Transcript_18818/m.28086 type:complete len:239 (+) Transcript_18818:495-1211(+)